jgi:hypothetical protein
MADARVIEERHPQKLRGRDRRSLNLSTKLTVAELKSIEAQELLSRRNKNKEK